MSNFLCKNLVNIDLFHADLMKGYKAAESNSADHKSLFAQCQAVADMKFTYVVSCQQYGIQKRSGEHYAKDILKLMRTYVCSNYFSMSKFVCWISCMVTSFFPFDRYPSLRIAYIDEVEETNKDQSKRMVQKVYYSVLVKVAAQTKSSESSEPVQSLDQVKVLNILSISNVHI